MINTFERNYFLFAKDYNFRELFIYIIKQLLTRRREYLNENLAEPDSKKKVSDNSNLVGYYSNKHKQESEDTEDQADKSKF